MRSKNFIIPPSFVLVIRLAFQSQLSNIKTIYALYNIYHFVY